MPEASGSPKEPATNTHIRSAIEQLDLFNHHREEVREARARWRDEMERRFDRVPRDPGFPRAAD